MIRLLFSLFLLTIALNVTAQRYSTESKKAIKAFEESLDLYNSRMNIEAEELLAKAIKIDENFVEAYLLLAEIYDENRKYEKEIEQLEKVALISPTYSYRIFYILAQTELKTGDYKSAKKHIEKCLSFASLRDDAREKSKNILLRTEFGIEAMLNPVDFDPINMGENINTEFDDYAPSLTADEEILYTTVTLPVDKEKPFSFNNAQEDFFVSYKKNNKWSKVVNVGPPINTNDNEGQQSIAVDGKSIYYAVCNREEDYGSCDIYCSYKKGKTWTDPRNIGLPINSSAWESQPSISSDGRTLYFSSNRKGGKGKKDIWYSVKDDQGKWSKVYNLSDKINTPGNEASPFIHPDNRTLYFVSSGLIGMGGFDIFVTRRDDNGEWCEPVNLGYPINTYEDEDNLIVNASGELAMFASGRGGVTGMDIYSFKLPNPLKPIPVTYVKGFVYDENTKKRLGAKLELIDIETSETTMETESDEVTGEYLQCLPSEKDYAFNSSKEGYMFYSENFSLKGMKDSLKPYEMNISMKKLKVDDPIVLKNIFFETDSYDLKGQSDAELSVLIKFLNTNPTVKIEIGGHTDNVGSKMHNDALSLNRAKSVYNYLVSKSIDKSRITFKGYGFSKPIDTNDTEQGRAKNRRTEFKITAI